MSVLPEPGMLGAVLRECRGNMAAVARRYGVTRQAVWLHVKTHPELQECVADCRETMLDDGENALHLAVLSGEPWAVCFYLKTQGRSRGYVERQEYRGLSDGDVNERITEELARLAASGPASAPGTAQGALSAGTTLVPALPNGEATGLP